MSNINEHQEYLIIAKLTGSLTEEEDQQFQQLYNDNTYIQNAYEEMKSKLLTTDVETSFARLKQSGEWKDIGGNLRKRRRKKRLHQAGVLLCTMSLIAAFIWFYFPEKNKDIAELNYPKKTTKTVLLTLADGEVVNVSSLQGSYQASSAKLSSSGNTLTYSNASKNITGVNRLVVPEGTDYKIVLADGSKIWLNASTQLQFPLNFSGSKREISIDGEAYLEVAKDSDKPFIVHLPNSTVQVTGTEFNINSYDSGVVKVSLVKGSVNMNALSRIIKLSPGQEGVLKYSSFNRQPFNLHQTLSWRNGLFYFQNADLKYLGKVIFRWYGVRVVLDNKNLSVKQFTGVIDKKRSIKEFMNDISSMSGIESYFDQDGVLHFK